MDIYNRKEQIGTNEDEDQNFSRYMDENGVIGLEEGGLELNSQEGEGDEQQEILDLKVQNMLEEDEEANLFIESSLDGQTSEGQSMKEKFSFSQMPHEKRNQDLIGIRDTDDLSFVDQPSISVTLPELGRRPPSRDQQLDMTEDEVDQGSSLGAWDGEDDENWNAQPDLFYDETENGRLEDYDQTSAGEEQWDNLPRSLKEDYFNMARNQEDETNNESMLPSSPPLPSTWDTRLFGMLSHSPGIEDETLPESSRTDSGEGSTAIPPGDHRKISQITQVSNQSRSLITKSNLSPSSYPNMQSTQQSYQKKSKNPIIAQYGRGQLNYPLPDFSKVGPRVKFPRDEQGYRPPQPRRQENQNQGASALFKSPAEIVKEVLLSSTEKPVEESAIPPSVPKEFKTPQQATELVHQLQEDYHKLLTKYAEAENTIDRLRLGAKVHLYSDPPKPSHSVQMGTVMQGSKVMEFTIPHAQAATFSSVNKDITTRGTDSSVTMNHPVTSPDVALPGHSFLHEPEVTLQSHLETLHREVDLFEGLLQKGNLTPEEQQQAVRELRGSLDVLERRYLKAQEHYRQGPRNTGRPSQELDPQRKLEEAIFQLGVQLEEIQERVDHSTLPNPSKDFTHTTHHLDNVPVPSAVVPIPATQTPYPQVTSPEPRGLPGTDTAKGTSGKEDPSEFLPQPLLYKHMQLEREYGTLLSTYSSFKSLPDALGQEQDEWPQEHPQIARQHDHQDGSNEQGHLQVSWLQESAQATRPQRLKTHVSSQSHQESSRPKGTQDQQLQTKAKRHSPRTSEQHHSRSITPQSFPTAHQTSPTDDMHGSSSASGTNVLISPPPTQQQRESSLSSRYGIVPDKGKSSFRRMSHESKIFPQRLSLSTSLPQLKEQSPRTPTTELSLSEESIPGSPSHKSTGRKERSVSYKESPKALKEGSGQRRILSPETDSGFLGSESGRSFSLQKQKHQVSLTREDPEETQDPTNAAVNNERRLSKNNSGTFSRTHKMLHDNKQLNKRWAGPSEASSPSLGPKSLTDSESREESHTDESDSDQERSNNGLGVMSSGASHLPLPTDEPCQSVRNIMESRVARDQAIHNLQKEVTQLREHLENSLNRSPARGKPALVQKQRYGEGPQLTTGLDSDPYRHKDLINDSRAEHQWRHSVSLDHEHTHQATQGGKGVQGPYTGTRYEFPDPLSIHTTEHVNGPHCQRCQESERKKHVTIKTSKEDESVPPTHPACLFCKRKNVPYNVPRTGMTNSENWHCPRRQQCQHWYMTHPPPVSYIPTPLVPYSPPVIYSTPPGIYVPAGYNDPDPDILHLGDLNDPLSQALEAAKELKITSKRMCRSLTMDLSMHRSLRGSCLF